MTIKCTAAALMLLCSCGGAKDLVTDCSGSYRCELHDVFAELQLRRTPDGRCLADAAELTPDGRVVLSGAQDASWHGTSQQFSLCADADSSYCYLCTALGPSGETERVGSSATLHLGR